MCFHIHYPLQQQIFLSLFLSKNVTKSPNISKPYHITTFIANLPRSSPSSFCSIFLTVPCKQVTFLFLFRHKLYNGHVETTRRAFVRILLKRLYITAISLHCLLNCYYSSCDITNVKLLYNYCSCKIIMIIVLR